MQNPDNLSKKKKTGLWVSEGSGLSVNYYILVPEGFEKPPFNSVFLVLNW